MPIGELICIHQHQKQQQHTQQQQLGPFCFLCLETTAAAAAIAPNRHAGATCHFFPQFFILFRLQSLFNYSEVIDHLSQTIGKQQGDNWKLLTGSRRGGMRFCEWAARAALVVEILASDFVRPGLNAEEIWALLSVHYVTGVELVWRDYCNDILYIYWFFFIFPEPYFMNVYTTFPFDFRLNFYR